VANCLTLKVGHVSALEGLETAVRPEKRMTGVGAGGDGSCDLCRADFIGGGVGTRLTTERLDWMDAMLAERALSTNAVLEFYNLTRRCIGGDI
jgi:hypothetical protein